MDFVSGLSLVNRSVDQKIPPSNHSSIIQRIRQIARKYDYDEVQFNTTSRVIAFKDKERKVRINIYYSTGTVGTSLFHPDRGSTQLFRYGCSIKEIEEIFRNPRVHTGKGHYRRPDSSYARSLPVLKIEAENHLQIADEATELRQAIIELQENRRLIDEQIQEANARLRSIELLAAQEEEKRKEEERKRQRAEEEERRKEEKQQLELQRQQERERQRKINRGDKVYYNALDGDDIDDNFSPSTRCIAMVGEATLMLDDYGNSTWTGGNDIPDKVRNVLRSQSKATAHYCALGCYGRYFLHIGHKSYWNAPDSLEAVIELNPANVRCIAFGEKFYDYIIIDKHDQIQWCGNFHGTLTAILNDADRRPIDFVSLGIGGTFFVRFSDGGIVLKKPPQSLNGYYAQRWFRDRLRSVIFNESNDWIARISSE